MTNRHSDAQKDAAIPDVPTYTDWPKIESVIKRDPVIEAEVQRLLNGMTLEQKVGQMTQAEIQHVTPEEVKQYHLGSILNAGGSHPNGNEFASAHEWVGLADSLWQASMLDDDGRLPVPIIWGTDAVHGHNNVVGATVFPHNIGLGATRNPELIEQISTATAREVAATGIDWAFAPTLAVVQDIRWGRSYEGYSAQADIVRAFAGKAVKGLQGNFSENHVIACAKHFIGDGDTSGGVDQGDSLSSELQLLNVHGQGYITALESGAQTVMASFSSWHGEKLHGHKYLLTDVLKDRMGFDGFVVSDWNGVGQVPGCTNSHCAMAINAGIDMVMAPYREDWQEFIRYTIAKVEEGVIPLARIDDAVSRILRVKLRAGLFNKPAPSQRQLAKSTLPIVGCDEHRALARQAVRESLVLLKNNAKTLPLKPSSRVLVVGKCADDLPNQCGGWSVTWQGLGVTNQHFPDATSIFEGIRSSAATVDYVKDLQWSEQDLASLKQKYDVVIAVLGEEPYAEGFGDIESGQSLDYALRHPEDMAVLAPLEQLGLPVVTILVTGRPLYINKLLNVSQALVAAWLPGSEGRGVSDVLFGDEHGQSQYDFTGRLSYNWPKQPLAFDINREGVDQPSDNENSVLFDYGYGLSYGQPHEDLGDLLEYDDVVDPESGVGLTQKVSKIFMLKSLVPWTLSLQTTELQPLLQAGRSDSSVGFKPIVLQHCTVHPVDDQYGFQFAGRKIEFKQGGLLVAHAGAQHALSWLEFLQQAPELAFDIKLGRVGNSDAFKALIGLNLLPTADGVAQASDQVVDVSQQLLSKQNEWQCIRVDWQQFVKVLANGAGDANAVLTDAKAAQIIPCYKERISAFGLQVEGDVEFIIANIRWEMPEKD